MNNPGIPVEKFTRANIPNVVYQTDKEEKLIKHMAKRVVYVSASSGRGSGIIFKSGIDYYVQTCRHVVTANAKETDIEDGMIEVSFGDTISESSQTAQAKIIGSCASQDKAIYRITSTKLVPSYYRKMGYEYLRDIIGLLVDIIIVNPKKPKKGLVEYDKSSAQFVIHTSIPYDDAADKAQYMVRFKNGAKAGCKLIKKCSKKCIRLYIDSAFVPNQTKTLFHLKPTFSYDPDWFVFVISFPLNCGKVKQISVGRPYSTDTDHPSIESSEFFKINHLKNAMVLKHTADANDGSSGGCVILIGKDLSSYLGYNSYLGMHIGEVNPGHRISTIGLIN